MQNKGITARPSASKLAPKAGTTSGKTYFGGKITEQQLKRWGVVVAIVLVVVLGLTVWAFIPNAPASPFSKAALTMLNFPDVQKELKLSDAQLTQFTNLQKERGEAMAYRETWKMTQAQLDDRQDKLDRAAAKAIPGILDAEQMKRLKQIYLQKRNRSAWNDPDVAKELQLTQQQKDEMADIQKQNRQSMAELFPRGNNPGNGPGNNPGNNAAPPPAPNPEEAQKRRAEMQKRMGELNKALEEKLLAVLTPEQQSTWQGMLGEPFQGQVNVPRGGFGPGGGGPGGFGPGGFGPGGGGPGGGRNRGG